MKESVKMLENKAEKSVLFMVNVYKMGFDHSTIGHFIDFLSITKKYSKATAICGINVVQKHLYQAALDISGRGNSNMKFANDTEDAKEWLINYK
jgi:hypothetical protein